MADLESYTKDHAATKYIDASRAELIKQEEPKKDKKTLDSETERILVTIVTTAAIGVPLAVLMSKFLPDLPIYEFCGYVLPYNLPF